MPRATNVKITKVYKTVQVVTIWWENNDFGDAPDIDIDKEMKLWDFVETQVSGAKSRKDLMIPKKLKGNKPEEWLLEQLQAVYDEMASESNPALLILIYSGHGSAPIDNSFLKFLGSALLRYTPRKELVKALPADAKGDDPKGLFWHEWVQDICVDGGFADEW
jgi:hypothetical protein